MDREDLEQLQIERLQTVLNRVYKNVSFYNKKFDEMKINIENIKKIEDIKYLPFTTKQDLRNSYPYNMFAVPLKDIIRIHSTSGTTGKPVIIGYTKNDIKNWEQIVARCLSSVGITNHDFIQISFNYGFFTGGLGFHYGAERIGASVIPASSTDNALKQIMVMKDYKSSVIVCTPSYAVFIAKTIEKLKIHPEELYLKKGIFGAEPWTEKTRSYLEKTFNIDAYDSYGLSEIFGPGVAEECEYKNGLHVNEDHFIVEIINPNTLEPVEEGSEGELVFTTLTKEGFPVIRYRTGDITSINSEKCECGRTLKRIARIKGRNDDLIFVNGSKFLPSEIEKVLFGNIENCESNYQIIIDKKDGIDTVEILVEVPDKIPFDENYQILRLQSEIEKNVEYNLELKTKITFVEPQSLNFSYNEKMRRVIDRRV